MKVKVKCLFNLRFCLGMHLFFGGTLYVFCIHFSLTRLKTKTIGKDDVGGAPGDILLHGWSEEISIFIFLLRLLWNDEEQNSSKARQELNMVILTSSRALVEESSLLLFLHVCIPLFCPLHWKEPVGLFSAAHILRPRLLEPSIRNLNGLHELMYKILS